MEFKMPDEVEGLVDTSAEVTEESTEETGNNPNWDALLSQIPDNLHHLVTPELAKWDQGVQQRFQKIQSESDGYAPYKDLMDQGVDPQAIQQAMSVMGMLNDKPDQFFKEMQAFYKDDPRFVQEQQFDNDQGQQEYDPDAEQPQFNLETDPRFMQMQEQQEIIANFLSNQVQEKENAAEDVALEAELKTLTETYGEYDEEFVLGLAQGGVDLEVAVKRFKAMETKYRTAPTPGSNFPTVVTPGGGQPTQALNPSEMNSHDTKNLIASYLATQNQ